MDGIEKIEVFKREIENSLNFNIVLSNQLKPKIGRKDQLV